MKTKTWINAGTDRFQKLTRMELGTFLPNLVKAVNVEAAETLEIFQWKKTSDKLSKDEQTHLKGEIALIYLFFTCAPIILCGYPKLVPY